MRRRPATPAGQPSVEERQKPAKQLPDKLPEEQQEGPFRKRGLKERKKEFLKKRKARKRGKGEDEDDLEERLLAGADKAAFGEQAMQPIKVPPWRPHLPKAIGALHQKRQAV